MELILVMMLVATVLAVAAPSLRSFARGRAEADAAARVLSMTQLARSVSATTGTPARLNVDPEAGLLWVTVQRGGTYVDLDTAIGNPVELPPDMGVKLELAPDQEQRNYVQFQPDGRGEQATIALFTAGGGVWQVVCPTDTDRFRVLKPWEGAQ
mgnify:CR=1 FL=1